MTLDPSTLLGHWRLLSWEAVDDDGRVSHPFGERPTGQIICLPDGWAAAQIAASGRPESVGDPAGGPVEDRARAYGTYLAYAGRYEVRGDTVVIRPEVSLYPEFLGSEQVRHVAFEDGDLVLRTPRVPLAGRTAVHELRWRREERGRAG